MNTEVGGWEQSSYFVAVKYFTGHLNMTATTSASEIRPSESV